MRASAEPQQDGQLSPGTIVDDRYEVLGPLGQGGFAVVYRARHVHIGHEVALKVLDLTVRASERAQFEERFRGEAKIAARLKHPNVVSVTDFGFLGAQRQPYLAMELLDGHDLEEELRINGPLDPKRAQGLFVEVLDALELGHESGVVHKDLKPANLFIADVGSDRERLVVLDFGIARMGDEPQARMTAVGMISGTPEYLSPEYVQFQTVTPAMDVYQMGLIIAESLSGLPIVRGSTPYECFTQHCSGELDLPGWIMKSPLGPVIKNALAVDHLERYATAGVLRDALRDIDASAVPSRARDRAPQAPRPEVALSDGPTKALPPVAEIERLADPSTLEHAKQNKTWLFAAIGVALIAGITVAVLFMSSGEPEGDKKGASAETSDAEGGENAATTDDAATAQAPVVMVDSLPSGAEIRVGDVTVGTTPHEFEVAEPVGFSLHLEGHETVESIARAEMVGEPLVVEMVALAEAAPGDDAALGDAALGDAAETEGAANDSVKPHDGSADSAGAKTDGDVGAETDGALTDDAKAGEAESGEAESGKSDVDKDAAKSEARRKARKKREAAAEAAKAEQAKAEEIAAAAAKAKADKAKADKAKADKAKADAEKAEKKNDAAPLTIAP